MEERKQHDDKKRQDMERPIAQPQNPDRKPDEEHEEKDSTVGKVPEHGEKHPEEKREQR